MPFLRDEGPPIPAASIQKYRESLPLDYGWQTVNETGREVLVVRVPKAKPDYLHDLSEVAFYVGLENIRNAKDVLLVGHEKCARLEPQLLRDHIRAQAREDVGVVDGLRRSLDRMYGHTFVQSPSNFEHRAFAVRIPKDTVAQFSPEDVNAIRQVVTNLRPRLGECQYAYVVANGDYERLGKRVLLELVGLGEPGPVAPTPSPPPAPTPSPAQAPPVARTPFPMTPGAMPAAAAAAGPTIPAPTMPAPADAPAPQPIVASQPAEPALVDVAAHEEYDIISKPKAAPTPAAAPARATPAGPHGALAGATTVEAEYEVVSKPKAAPAPAAAPTTMPAGPHGALAGATTVEAEYEVVSKPKAAPAAPSPASEAAEPEASDKKVLHAEKEYEVFTSKAKPRPAPTVTPPGMGGFQAAISAAGYGAPQHAPTRTKEYEIIGKSSVTSDASIASKIRLPSATPGPAPASAMPGLPRIGATGSPPPVAQPASTPPMQAAPPTIPHLHFPATPPPGQVPAPAPAAPAYAPPAPAPAPVAAPAMPTLPHLHFPAAPPGGQTPVAPAVPTPAAPVPETTPALPHIHFPVAPAAPPEPATAPSASPVPEPVVAIPPRVATVALPAADSGATIVPKVTTAAPELALAQRFRDAGYEVVEGLRAQGTVFAFAAHRANGRRVLVKRATEFGPDDASALAQLVAALGADVSLVIADTVKPGTRLATWGTRIEVVTPTDAAALAL